MISPNDHTLFWIDLSGAKMEHTVIHGEPGIGRIETLFLMLQHKDTEREYCVYLTKEQAKSLGKELLEWAGK